MSAAAERTLGAVVVGTGFGCSMHVRALRAAGFEVRALVARDAAKTAERAARAGVPRALTSLAEALALPGVAAITIATPPHTHAELALAALRAGRHVLCEKPFARDAAEARRVLAEASAAGVVHLLGTEYRFDTGQALMAQALADGVVGEPRLATFLLHVATLADPAAQVPAWWADAAQGGGWLGAHGSQVIDQIRFALGEFAGVSASLPHVAGPGMTAEDGFVVHFRMRSGAVGTLQSTSGDRGHPLIATRVTGTRGSVWIEGVGDRVFVADAGGTRRLPVPEALRTAAPVPAPLEASATSYERMLAHGLDFAPYVRLAACFRDRILGRPPDAGHRPATFADGVAQMEVLDAIRRSAAAGGAWTVVA